MFKTYFALIIISNISYNNCGLSWILRCDFFQRSLISANHHDLRPLVHIPVTQSLADSRTCACNDNPFIEKIILSQWLLELLLHGILVLLLHHILILVSHCLIIHHHLLLRHTILVNIGVLSW